MAFNLFPGISYQGMHLQRPLLPLDPLKIETLLRVGVSPDATPTGTIYGGVTTHLYQRPYVRPTTVQINHHESAMRCNAEIIAYGTYYKKHRGGSMRATMLP